MIATLGVAHEAVIREHEYCSEFDSAVEEERVLMTCTCGATINRMFKPAPQSKCPS
jgi:hypothetical protein